MEIKSLYFILRMAGLLTIGTSLLASCYYDQWIAIGLITGSAWSCVNFYFLKQLLETHLTPDTISHRGWKRTFFIFLKYPLLFGIGYQILKLDMLPISSLLIGFSLLFVAICLFGLKLCLTNFLSTKEVSHGN